MPKQTEMFDEMDRLRDEVRQAEEMGAQIAYLLDEERAKNASLTDEMERLRNSGDRGVADWGLSEFVPHPNDVMPLCSGCGFVALVMSFALFHVRADQYDFDYAATAVLRFVAQMSFFVWCIGVFIESGAPGLVKRISVWALAWAGSMGIIAKANSDLPSLKYQLITLANPANWWTLPFATVGQGGGLILLLFFAATDITMDFEGSRWAFAKFMELVEKIKEGN